MSPISSSRFLVGRNTPARLRCEPSRLNPSSGHVDACTTLRHEPPARRRTGARARADAGCSRRWYRGAIVRGGPRVLAGLARPARALARQRRRVRADVRGFGGRLAASRLRRPRARTRTNPPGPTRWKSRTRASRPCRSIARPATMALVVRNSGGAAAAERRGHGRLLQLHSSYPELADSSRPIWVIERGPGAIARPPVETQERQPARRRPDGLRQHLGARPPRARGHAHVPLAGGAGQGRRSTRSTTRSPPGWPARRRRDPPPGRPSWAASRSPSRRAPPADARRPEHRQGARGRVPQHPVQHQPLSARAGRRSGYCTGTARLARCRNARGV